MSVDANYNQEVKTTDQEKEIESRCHHGSDTLFFDRVKSEQSKQTEIFFSLVGIKRRLQNAIESKQRAIDAEKISLERMEDICKTIVDDAISTEMSRALQRKQSLIESERASLGFLSEAQQMMMADERETEDRIKRLRGLVFAATAIDVAALESFDDLKSLELDLSVLCEKSSIVESRLASFVEVVDSALTSVGPIGSLVDMLPASVATRNAGERDTSGKLTSMAQRLNTSKEKRRWAAGAGDGVDSGVTAADGDLVEVARVAGEATRKTGEALVLMTSGLIDASLSFASTSSGREAQKAASLSLNAAREAGKYVAIAGSEVAKAWKDVDTSGAESTDKVIDKVLQAGRRAAESAELKSALANATASIKKSSMEAGAAGSLWVSALSFELRSSTKIRSGASSLFQSVTKITTLLTAAGSRAIRERFNRQLPRGS